MQLPVTVVTLLMEACALVQVPRAAEYFRRWISKWPTVADLAAATEGEVNEMWAGLGYYRCPLNKRPAPHCCCCRLGFSGYHESGLREWRPRPVLRSCGGMGSLSCESRDV